MFTIVDVYKYHKSLIMCVFCSQPDVMAPGVLILAALPPPKTAKPSTPEFGLRSGTSMSCPHVSGAAAFVKAHRPSWTPSMIKSALMTTGIDCIFFFCFHVSILLILQHDLLI